MSPGHSGDVDPRPAGPHRHLLVLEAQTSEILSVPVLPTEQKEFRRLYHRIPPPHVDRSSVPVRRHLHVVLDDDEDLSVPPGPGLGPGSHDPEVLPLLLDDLLSVTESECLCHLPHQISLLGKIIKKKLCWFLEIFGSHLLPPSVHPDLQYDLPAGIVVAKTVVRVLQRLQETIERARSVVCENYYPDI